mmetsp:Transcript_15855/g.25895  ORF Transcript_15855/g.25895 Transcript_15855/m.25895 type:complete len:101 (-) Transcript_15855:189-491(-)
MRGQEAHAGIAEHFSGHANSFSEQVTCGRAARVHEYLKRGLPTTSTRLEREAKSPLVFFGTTRVPSVESLVSPRFLPKMCSLVAAKKEVTSGYSTFKFFN